MPTLAEILAAKAAKTPIATTQSPQAAESGLSKPSGETSSTSPRGTGGGIRITPETEKAVKAAEIKGFLDASAPKVRPPTPRELGATEPGEQIPMDHPAQDASEADMAWFSACHSFETELGIVIEPGSENGSPMAWIAICRKHQDNPILLHRLPLLSRRQDSASPF